nr:ribosomal protein S7 [Meringosphaera mediterranea]
MARRKVVKRRYPSPDPTFNSLLVSLLILRVLKKGKKRLANSIVQDTFAIVKTRTGKDPLFVFEKAIKNVTPDVEVKAKRVGGSIYQVPLDVSCYRGTTLALKWILKASKDRSGRAFSNKLATEIIEAYNGIGNAIRKRNETHRMAEANKAFSHFK